VANANHRLQAEMDENVRLRRELEEARAKLDAIANIERSLNERKPGARDDDHSEQGHDREPERQTQSPYPPGRR